jgi:GAF domain-containing protein
MGTDTSGPLESRGRPSTQAGPGASGTDLSQRLADLARDMQRHPDNSEVMDVIVAAVVGTVPGVEEASISLVRGRRHVYSAAATGDLARRFDELQEQTKQGPCMESMYEHETVHVDDIASDPRWPELARAAGELGVGSMLCFQLFVVGDDLGALNLLARRPGAFTDESERIGLLFASHAAVAVAQARKVNHLQLALATRDVIGQAKGVLMERYKVTADQAFALLAQLSQDTNRKLHDVADYLTRTGADPSEHRRGGDDDPSEESSGSPIGPPAP